MDSPTDSDDLEQAHDGASRARTEEELHFPLAKRAGVPSSTDVSLCAPAPTKISLNLSRRMTLLLCFHPRHLSVDCRARRPVQFSVYNDSNWVPRQCFLPHVLPVEKADLKTQREANTSNNVRSPLSLSLSLSLSLYLSCLLTG